MKKINVFLLPVIDRREDGTKFVNENRFVVELEYPYDIDWYADDRKFAEYIRKHTTEILDNTPVDYISGIFVISLRDTLADKTRTFYFILED